MLEGVDTFVLKSGRVATVRWTRPEVGVDITQEEYDRRVQSCADTCFRVFSEQCMDYWSSGEKERAESLWDSLDFGVPPPWETA